MKLVDILARELKEWPEGQKIAEQSKVDNEIYFEPKAFGDFYVPERADDYMGALVTRSQWQEARDALLKADSKEWNGEGLPPVGTVCEFRIPEEFEGVSPWRPELRQGSRVEIIYRYDTGVSEVAAFKFDVAVGCLVEQASAGCFRPIRTPEQIAAEERENDIAEAMKVMAVSGVHTSAEACLRIATAYVDAGYRKQEPK